MKFTLKFEYFLLENQISKEYHNMNPKSEIQYILSNEFKSLKPDEFMIHQDTLDKEKKEPSVKKPKKPRCFECNKKLKMTELNFKCKCEHTFCQLHLTPHSHSCSFNYLQAKRDIIKQNNPKMCVQCIEVK